MNKRLHHKFERLEAARKELLKSVRLVDPARRHYQPDGEQWSLVQILDHLIRAEEGVLRYLQKKNQAGNPQQAGMGEALRALTMHLVLRSPLKLKIPSAIPPPENTRTAAELEQEWKQVRRELRLFLEKLPEDRTRAKLFRHPLVGYLNIFQTLRFLEDHLRHHQRQIKRLVKYLNAHAEVVHSQ